MYVLIVTSIFTGLATLCVALRLYTRFRLVKAPGLDDLLISAALLIDLPFYAFVLAERSHGIGIPRAQLSEYDLRRQLFWLWISVPFYNVTLILAKLSALTLFIRVFRPRRFLLAAYILMGCLVIAGLWMIFSGFIYCIPTRAFWDLSPEFHRAHCLHDAPVWFTNAGIQIFTDLLILALPMPLLWMLQLPKRKKWGVVVVFSLGILVVITSSVRLYELNVMVSVGDFTKANAETAVWSSLEANISIICVCLPPLYPLFSRVFAFFFRPRPVHSSHSRRHSKTHLAEPSHEDGGIWYNELFTPGPARYTASVSKVDTNETEPENEEGIRVKRELRMQSDTVDNIPALQPHFMNGPHLDVEMGERVVRSSIANGDPSSIPSVERDFGDFDFPDYKERMNAPI
ncbi:unnamed protein product [Penicillium glandicola]